MREHVESFLDEARPRSAHGFGVPRHVERELRNYLTCGVLAHGFVRVRCVDCGFDRLVAFACKGRAVCPSCRGRRMADAAARRVSPTVRRGPDIATLARVLGDPSRVAMLDTLLDGEAHRIGQLARRAGITAATASSHLARLVEARLVEVAAVGRERHVRLASPEVAALLERLATLAAPTASSTLAARTRTDELRFARTCYDHLAGVLAIWVATALTDRGWLHRTTDSFEPAPALFDWLAARGRAVPLVGRRPLSRACLDWSERVPHVAGRIGVAIADVFLAERWVSRARDSRALRLTDRGRIALTRELGLALPTHRRG